MNILIVRHAIAEDRDAFALQNANDDERPLTDKGIARMQEAAQGLARIAPLIDLLAYSPLVRTRQTADILRPVLNAKQEEELDQLAPGMGPISLSQWLARCSLDCGVCLVGHEPDLSELVAWLTAGKVDGFVNLKKGAACLVSCANDIAPGPSRCKLIWSLSPKQLRMLAKD